MVTNLVQSSSILAEALGKGGQVVLLAMMAACQVGSHSNDGNEGVVLEV